MNDISDKQFSQLANYLLQEMEKENSRNHLINPGRVNEMSESYALCEKISKDSGLKINYEINKPYKSMGSITMAGKHIEFDNCQLFNDACRNADSVEFIPRTKELIEVVLTFHRLATPLK